MGKGMNQKGRRRERGVLGGGWRGCVRRQAETWQAGTASWLRNFSESVFASYLHAGVWTCSSKLLRLVGH